MEQRIGTAVAPDPSMVDRVLVAEADEAVRAVCVEWLSFPGREVVAVEPRAAAALLGGRRWDALVLGWGGGPGEAYAMALATGLPAGERPAVVLLARDVSGPSLRTVFRAGATDVVGVPFEPRHLAAVVLSAMDEVLTARPGHALPAPVPETTETLPARPPMGTLFERLRAEAAAPPPGPPSSQSKDQNS